MPPVPLSKTAAWQCTLTLLLAPMVLAAEPDPALTARAAIAYLEQGPVYAWEIRDLDGEIDNKTVWKEPSPKAEQLRATRDLTERQPLARKVKIRTLSPTVQGVYRPDGWAVTEAGFAKGPKVMAVLHPSGTRVVRSDKGEWLTARQFKREYDRKYPDLRLLMDPKEQKTYSSSWAAFTSPVPHILLPELLRDAVHFRVEQDEIVAEVSVDSARLLLGQDGGSRKLAPGRFKGSARLRVREGVLRECRIQLDYDVDLTRIKDPSTESIDILILLLAPSGMPPAVPEAARAVLSNG
jgi:hypothetical protein